MNIVLVREALLSGISPVVIDNTNTAAWEMKPYVIMVRERVVHSVYVVVTDYTMYSVLVRNLILVISTHAFHNWVYSWICCFTEILSKSSK